MAPQGQIAKLLSQSWALSRQLREEDVAYIVARVDQVLVGGIFAPVLLLIGQVGQNVLACKHKQGADETHALMAPDRANAAEASKSGPPRQPMDQGLGIVITMMARGNGRTRVCLCQGYQAFKAPLSACGFNGAVMGLCVRSCILCFADKGHSPGGRQIVHKDPVLYGLVPELVVEVHAHEILDETLRSEADQQGKKGGGVCPTRDGHQEAGLL